MGPPPGTIPAPTSKCDRMAFSRLATTLSFQRGCSCTRTRTSGRRKIVHFNITDSPTAAWTAQQIINAFPYNTVPEYLLRDRDSIYGSVFVQRVVGMGIKQKLISPRSPWQSPYVERLVGSIRRECLNRVMVFNERQLRRVLESYLEYYHKIRPHRSLSHDSPIPRAVEAPDDGKVIEMPLVGGLHHQYRRQAA